MLEKDLIKSIKENILEKKKLIQITNRILADEIFQVVNSMDEKVVSDYIRYYCYQYIDTIKDNTETALSGRVQLMSTNVYPLIAPNSSNIKSLSKLLDGCENTKKFIDNINIIGEEIKYEIFNDFIEHNKPLRDLHGQLFQKSNMLDIMEQYIKNSRDKFESYIFYFIKNGLYKRSIENKNLISSKEVNTIISYIIVGKDNLADMVKSDEIFNIISSQYNNYCKNLVSSCIDNKKPLNEVNRCLINDKKVMDVFLEMNNDIKQKYIRERMDYYLSIRKMMTFEDFKRDCICSKKGNFSLQTAKQEYKEVNKYIESLYDLYSEKLIQGNRAEIKLNSDRWILFFKNGPRINYRCFEFNEILSDKFKYEIKLYMMEECTHRIENNITLSLVKNSVNFLYSRNKECDSFAKIDLADIRALDTYLQKELVVKRTCDNNKKRAVGTISKIINRMKYIIDYLIKYDKKNNLATPTPKYNPFTNIRYRNKHKMSERTDIIPDIVLEQMNNFVNELNPTHQLMYEIFQNTGMRLSSVYKLKEDCLATSRYDNVMILKYTPYKLENYNKKKGKLSREHLIIPLELGNKIQKQIDATKELREKYNMDYIFISINEKIGKIRPSLNQGSSFVAAVNRIIKKNNIVDYNGELWNFTSRQFRKTLVSIMMDNNATDSEIAYVLGHNSQKTLNNYYKEINEQKIENLNHEFFKKRFGIDIGEDNLSQYTEEEKRCLYIDFLTNYRRVPLGYCSKSIKDGPCDKEAGASSCEKCPKICTGKNFLPEWIKLKEDRQRELDELIVYYNNKNISKEEYLEYKEYKHILYELKLYNDAINKINEKCHEGV